MRPFSSAASSFKLLPTARIRYTISRGQPTAQSVERQRPAALINDPVYHVIIVIRPTASGEPVRKARCPMDNALGVPALVPEAIVLDLKRRAERPTARRLPLSEIKPGLCNRIRTSAFDGKGGLPISGPPLSRRAALPGVGRFGMDQFPGPRHALPSGMASVPYRCATTGMNVQAWFADDVSDDNLYVSLRCPACARVHLVNRAGKTLLPPMP
jgi:hypothetical protein